jgi:hypothetical protein
MAPDVPPRVPFSPARIPTPRRDGEHGGGVPPGAAYRQALQLAYDLGRTDGRIAAALGLAEVPDPTGPVCRGRDAATFARLLWGAGPGPVPSGLEVNAPLWYAAGMADELSDD